MRISDWSSDVCSSDLPEIGRYRAGGEVVAQAARMARRVGARGGPATLVGRAGPRRAATPAAAGRVDDPHQALGGSAGLRPHPRGGRVDSRPGCTADPRDRPAGRSEEHTSELQSLMRTSYAVFCLKKKNNEHRTTTPRRPLES